MKHSLGFLSGKRWTFRVYSKVFGSELEESLSEPESLLTERRRAIPVLICCIWSIMEFVSAICWAGFACERQVY